MIGIKVALKEMIRYCAFCSWSVTILTGIGDIALLFLWVVVYNATIHIMMHTNNLTLLMESRSRRVSRLYLQAVHLGRECVLVLDVMMQEMSGHRA